MLASMEPGKLDELIAVARIRPFGDDQLTRLAMASLQYDGHEVSYADLREREEVTGDGGETDQAAMWNNVRRALGG